MLECQQTESGTVNAILIFKREELLYDIKNMAFVEGDLMTDEFMHQRHIVQDIGEEGNVDRVTRVLDLTIAEIREMLYPYTKHDLHDVVLDNRFTVSKMYGIVLTVPDTFSQTTLSLLERLIHEVLTCKVLADWLRIAHPEKAVSWIEKSEEALTKIKNSLHSRMQKLRIRPHLF